VKSTAAFRTRIQPKILPSAQVKQLRNSSTYVLTFRLGTGSDDRLYWRIVYTWAILPPHRIPAETDTSRNGSQLCNGATVLSLCQRRVCFLGPFAEVPDRGFEFDKRGRLSLPRTMKRLPSRWATTTKMSRFCESMLTMQPQLQPALLRFSVRVSHWRFTWQALCLYCSPQGNHKMIRPGRSKKRR